METARQFITFTAVSKAGRNRALGCWLTSIPRRIMAVVVTAALATCALCFAPTVFAQPASDTLGELLVGKAAFGDWRTDAGDMRGFPPTILTSGTRSAASTARAKRGYKCGLLERRCLDDGASSPLMIHVFDVADQIADDF